MDVGLFFYSMCAKYNFFLLAMTRDELLKFEAEGIMTVLNYELTKEDITVCPPFLPLVEAPVFRLFVGLP